MLHTPLIYLRNSKRTSSRGERERNIHSAQHRWLLNEVTWGQSSAITQPPATSVSWRVPKGEEHTNVRLRFPGCIHAPAPRLPGKTECPWEGWTFRQVVPGRGPLRSQGRARPQGLPEEPVLFRSPRLLFLTRLTGTCHPPPKGWKHISVGGRRPCSQEPSVPVGGIFSSFLCACTSPPGCKHPKTHSHWSPVMSASVRGHGGSPGHMTVSLAHSGKGPISLEAHGRPISCLKGRREVRHPLLWALPSGTPLGDYQHAVVGYVGVGSPGP